MGGEGGRKGCSIIVIRYQVFIFTFSDLFTFRSTPVTSVPITVGFPPSLTIH